MFAVAEAINEVAAALVSNQEAQPCMRTTVGVTVPGGATVPGGVTVPGGATVPAIQGVVTKCGQQPDVAGFDAFLRAASREMSARLGGVGWLSVEVEPVLEPKQFAAFAQRVARSPHHPLLTWHGTTLDAAASIVRDGYVAAGDVNLNSGEQVPMVHGNVYGDGIYTSTLAGLSACFAESDCRGSVILLANAVAIGPELREIDPAPSNLRRTVHVSGKTIAVTDVPSASAPGAGWAYDADAGKWVVSAAKGAVTSHPPVACDTAVHRGLNIVVSTDAEDVLPLFKVYLRQTGPKYPHIPNAALPRRERHPEVVLTRACHCQLMLCQLPVPSFASDVTPTRCQRRALVGNRLD